MSKRVPGSCGKLLLASVMYKSLVYYNVIHMSTPRTMADTHMTVSQSQPRLEKVNVNEIMEKMASKKDVYNFLTIECEAYLPKLDSINMFFLKQITRGMKEVSCLISQCVVHQALCGEGGRSATDRRSHRRGLPVACAQEACAAAIPA